MQILLASLLMLWSNLSGTNHDVTLDQVAKAAVQAAQPPVTQPADSSQTSQQGDGDGFVKQDPQPDAPVVKGIYTTAYSAGVSRFDNLVKLVDDTDLNAMVIDVKDDNGYITYDTEDPQLKAMGTSKKIMDVHKVMDTLNQHQIYPIARIVVFKDTVLAKKRPDLSFLNSNGSLWANDNKDSFVNPYMKEVWDYNIAVAKDAAKMGFKEIQFDYVRFAEGFENRADTLKYTKDDRTRIQVIADFVKYAREQLDPLGVRVSVDIFGYSASVPAAEGIGQDFNAISKYVDVISPMVYPSHYSTDWFGLKVPDAHPYDTINGAMKDTHKKLDQLGKLQPIIRPWIQDFTATWVPGHITYGKQQIEDQIRALKDNHIDQYMLWDPTNKFTRGVTYN